MPAPPCLLDGTLWRNLTTVLSLKTSLGPTARPFQHAAFQIPNQDLPAQTLTPHPDYHCNKHNKRTCQWDQGPKSALQYCALWKQCAGFVCNQQDICFARAKNDFYPKGAPFTTTPPVPNKTLYLMLKFAFYSFEAVPNCGKDKCSWNLAHGLVRHGEHSTVVNMTRSDGAILSGVLSSPGCGEIVPSDASWKLEQVNMLVTKVHMIFMAHFDVGYIVPTVDGILNSYIFDWFPRALRTSADLRARGGPEQFAWTTHPWLLEAILQNFTGRTTLENVSNIDAAIRRGDLVWHRNAMNFQTEGADRSHMEFGLSLADKLDTRFDIPVSHSGRLGASQKDEPGLTIGAVKMMADAGVKLLHIGANDFSTVPALPSSSAHFHGFCNPYILRDSGATSFADEERRNESELIVAHCSGYSEPFDTQGEFPTMSILIPNMDEALVFLMHVDNTGPQTSEQALEAWQSTQRLYPKAKLELSNLGAFASAIEKARRIGRVGEDSLPTVSDVEIGSTWIYGLASSPRKFRRYRAAARVRAQAVASQNLSLISDPRFMEFSSLLLKVPEHTAGFTGAGCNGPPWSDNIFRSPFASCRVGGEAYNENVESWLDQSAFVDRAVRALQDLQPFRSNVEAAILESEPLSKMPRWPTREMEPYIPGTSVQITLGGDTSSPLVVTFNRSGALISLAQEGEHEAVAPVAAEYPLGLLSYRFHSQEELNLFAEEYTLRGCAAQCGNCGFSKCNISHDGAVSTRLFPLVSESFYDASNGEFLFKLKFPCRDRSVSCRSAPTLITQRVKIEIATQGISTRQVPRFSVAFDLQLWGKSPTRMAESIWFTFRPNVPSFGPDLVDGTRSLWRMDKLGRWVDPLSVAMNGSKTMHGVWNGIRHFNRSMSSGWDVEILTRDAPIVSPGTFQFSGAFNFPRGSYLHKWPGTYAPPDDVAEPRPDRGWNFLLFGNSWSTNYPLWALEETMRFRFGVTV